MTSMPRRGDETSSSYDLVFIWSLLQGDIYYSLSMIIIGMVKAALGVQLVHNNFQVLRII